MGRNDQAQERIGIGELALGTPEPLLLLQKVTMEKSEESFAQAGARHLHDAKILLSEERWDNAVYLAGYVAECAFKVLVKIYIDRDSSAAKKYGHDLKNLEGKAMERLRIIYPVLNGQFPGSRTSGTVLARWNPEQRYAKSGLWSESEADAAVERATEIYSEIVTKLILDGRIYSREL